MEISFDNFLKVDIRAGKVVDVLDFPEARKPAYKMYIDFGELGIKQTSAQITDHYTKEDLVGKMVLAVTNFPKKQIGPFMSEVLTLGLSDEEGNIVLVHPGLEGVPPGARLH